MQTENFKETVLLVDADYADGVAFDLTVNFERMLMRRVRSADLAQWLVCMALDGGLSEGENEVQAVFLHTKPRMQNFVPGDLAGDIDGKAFRDERLGEFLMSAVRDERLTGECLFTECAQALLGSSSVKRILLVPDMERYGAELKRLLAQYRDKEVTLLAMQPEAGRGFRSEILGYSLMQALGIRGEEIERMRTR
ncbi:MAG: hypothetical protein K2H79_04120 [Bacteroidaceae bacterium]|nr:hypothetical protein [Bacteroidaceae bacterium]